ncbi:MAG: IPExxxVDY family protein [Flavobacteriales bacterium]|nr:IPExxxVDY family protein [Flavobacteriales bacterium]
MAKLKLDSIPQPDVFLIAISSHVNDYRLCWSLNKSLGLELSRRDEDIAGQGPERMAHFSAFDHTEEETQANITLISNHAPEGVLVADQRQADFFLVVDDQSSLLPDDTLERVRNSEFVLTAFTLDINNIKGAYKLLE